MNIIVSIRSIGIPNFNSQFKILYQNGIRFVRVNLKTLATEEQTQKCMDMVINLITNYPDIRILLDIGYPGTTPRMHILNRQHCIKVKKDELLNIKFSGIGNKVFCDRFDSSKLQPGTDVIFGDGELMARIWKIDNTSIQLRMVNDGIIWDGRTLQQEGILIHNKELKNYKEFIDKIPINNLKGIALSFVHSADECIQARDTFGPNVHCVAKIEDKIGATNINNICGSIDEIFIGRGDLYFHVSNKEYWNTIENCLSIAKAKSKKLIIGTDILESFSYQTIPNRADLVDFLSFMKYEPESIVLSAKVAFSPYIECCMDWLNKF